MKRQIRAILVLSLLVGGGISLLATARPDALEGFLERFGWAGEEQPGSTAWGTSLTGIMGALITFGFLTLLLRLLGRWRRERREP